MRDPFDGVDVDGLSTEDIDKLIDEQMDLQLEEFFGIDTTADVDSSFGWDPADLPTQPMGRAYTNPTGVERRRKTVTTTPKSGIEQLAEELKNAKNTNKGSR